MKPQKLIESNKRFTKARRALLEVLKDRHLTFKEIYEELSKKDTPTFQHFTTTYSFS